MKHGTENMYVHAKCRCLPCTDASRASLRARRTPAQLAASVAGARLRLATWQRESLSGASRKGLVWEGWEYELLNALDLAGRYLLRSMEVAELTGRTYTAVATKRKVRNGALTREERYLEPQDLEKALNSTPEKDSNAA